MLCAQLIIAKSALENVWHETGEYKCEEGFKIHADISQEIIKEGGYFIVRFYDENGKPIEEMASFRGGRWKRVPLTIQTQFLPLSIIEAKDLKDYTVFVPFRKLRKDNKGGVRYYKMIMSKDPNGQNAISEIPATKFYVPDY